MLRAIISPILKSTRLWYKALTMLPSGDQDEVEQFHLILVTSSRILAF